MAITTSARPVAASKYPARSPRRRSHPSASGTTIEIGSIRRRMAPPNPSAVMFRIRPTVGRITKTPMARAMKDSAAGSARVENAGTWYREDLPKA
jgi:hypothetical protein